MSKTIQEEAGLGEHWVPLDEIKPGKAVIGPPTSDTPPLLQGSIPPSYQLSPDFRATGYESKNVPSLSLMPLGIQGNPSTNAAAQSTASTTPSVVPTPATPSTVTLDIPDIFTPVDQTVTLPGPLAFTLAPENPNTFLGVLPPGLSSITGLTTGASQTGFPGSGNASVSATPTTPTSWGIYIDNCQGNQAVTPPAGWTGFSGNSSATSNYYQSFSGNTPVSVTQPLTFDSGVLNGLILFGGVPSLVQQADTGWGGGGAGPVSSTATFGGSTTAGNMLLIIMMGGGSASGGYSNLDFTTTGGNTFNTLINQNQHNSGITSNSLLIAVCPSCVGGAVSVTGTIYSNGTVGGRNALLLILELGPLAAGSQIPLFVPITPDALPPINLSGGGVYGILGVANGGTGDYTLAAHGVLIGEGTSPVNVTTPGTAGQVLTSNGASADPTFQAISAAPPIVKFNGSGTQIDRKVFINGVTDGAAVWTFSFNGTADGG